MIYQVLYSKQFAYPLAFIILFTFSDTRMNTVLSKPPRATSSSFHMTEAFMNNKWLVLLWSPLQRDLTIMHHFSTTHLGSFPLPGHLKLFGSWLKRFRPLCEQTLLITCLLLDQREDQSQEIQALFQHCYQCIHHHRGLELKHTLQKLGQTIVQCQEGLPISSLDRDKMLKVLRKVGFSFKTGQAVAYWCDVIDRPDDTLGNIAREDILVLLPRFWSQVYRRVYKPAYVRRTASRVRIQHTLESNALEDESEFSEDFRSTCSIHSLDSWT